MVLLFILIITVIASSVFAQQLPQNNNDANKTAQCQAQLAETTWSYEQLTKDRQMKELQRDKSEVRAYILEREVQGLRKQIADMKKAAEPPAPAADKKDEKKE